jgi:ATP synthase protein I
MSRGGAGLRNIVLISQVAIAVMTPIFLCVAVGVWLDKKFGTWFTLPLLIIGILAGARSGYVLVMDVIRAEEAERKRKLEEDIRRKVAEANDDKENVTKNQ